MHTILIVDDTPANVSVLLRTLGDAGYRTLVAEDGEEALEQVRHTTPDLVLLDVMMPGIDGFETCRRLRDIPAMGDVPVIFMTALAETADKLRAFAAGAVDYVTKPIQHQEALARVATHLTLRQLRRQLADELALRERFMRIAAHDLRNPLFLILMAAAVARRAGGGDARLAGALSDIQGGAEQMRRIIDTFLQIGSAGSGGDSSGTIPRTDLIVVAESAVRQQQAAASSKEISLTIAQPSSGTPVPAVRAEVTHIYQALTNYLTNALKFTPAGGSVAVTLSKESGGVRTSVTDSGPGVPESERVRLFTEYAQLTPRPTGGEESHGLGLCIVRQLVEAQGGRVGVDFPASGGSCFWFELPVG